MSEQLLYIRSELAGLRSDESRVIQALGRCPGQVVFFLQVSLLISSKQPQRIFELWDVWQYNICMLHEMSGMDLE